MRIISGTRKGHIIRAPKSLPIRPTTDLSKESLFNILVNYFDFDEIRILDLFSGSGNISLEFASRDASDITAVDKHSGCANFLKNESEKLGFGEAIHVVRADVLQYARNCDEQYDIIFADPPYAFNQKQYDELVRVLLDEKLLTHDGWLIVEHHSVTKLEHVPELFDQRAYGQNIMSFFRYRGKDEKE